MECAGLSRSKGKKLAKVPWLTCVMRTCCRWNIDVGNGFSTFIPSIVFNLCMTWDLGISARILGMVAVAMYWQEMYGERILD